VDVRPALIALGIVVAAASVAAAALLLDGGDDWRTYRNERFGYEIRYPPDWPIDIRNPQPGDDFESQRVAFTRDPNRVIASVNFQGDWCTTGRPQVREITVSGVPGQEYVCYDEGQRDPFQLVLHLPDRNGRSYTVLSQSRTDFATVEKIVRSFRFLE
jgi:hypothetical protein